MAADDNPSSAVQTSQRPASGQAGFGAPMWFEDAEARDLAEARDEMRRGRIGEALVHVERALGPEFIGRLTCLAS
jgi:hypothetical protein